MALAVAASEEVVAGRRSVMPGLYLCGSGQHLVGEVSGIPGHNAAAL